MKLELWAERELEDGPRLLAGRGEFLGLRSSLYLARAESTTPAELESFLGRAEMAWDRRLLVEAFPDAFAEAADRAVAPYGSLEVSIVESSLRLWRVLLRCGDQRLCRRKFSSREIKERRGQSDEAILPSSAKQRRVQFHSH